MISAAEFHLPAGTGGSGSSCLAPGTELSGTLCKAKVLVLRMSHIRDVTNLTTAKKKKKYISQTKMKH